MHMDRSHHVTHNAKHPDGETASSSYVHCPRQCHPHSHASDDHSHRCRCCLLTPAGRSTAGYAEGALTRLRGVLGVVCASQAGNPARQKSKGDSSDDEETEEEEEEDEEEGEEEYEPRTRLPALSPANPSFNVWCVLLVRPVAVCACLLALESCVSEAAAS
jgi:hypothetical protein